ncbi:MAG: ABC transporter permease, partial [Kamptonema sp. SIO1D9]|nr:ABC transporter permease [Kamptonema sp. SIO1D9]
DNVELKLIVFFLPILQTIQFLLTVSLAYILAAINVTFRDTQHTLGVLLQLFFYLTPIFYQIDNVPAKYLPLYNLNPMVHLITAYRNILIYGTAPDWQALLIIGIATVIFLPVGLYIFRVQSDRFVEEL